MRTIILTLVLAAACEAQIQFPNPHPNWVFIPTPTTYRLRARPRQISESHRRERLYRESAKISDSGRRSAVMHRIRSDRMSLVMNPHRALDPGNAGWEFELLTNAIEAKTDDDFWKAVAAIKAYRRRWVFLTMED